MKIILEFRDFTDFVEIQSSDPHKTIVSLRSF